jgi:hypothetical protein
MVADAAARSSWQKAAADRARGPRRVCSAVYRRHVTSRPKAGVIEMRDKFWSYYSLDEASVANVWATGAVVPDANVLLNLYRYRPETRQQLLDILSSLGERLWVPFQVAAEYQDRRLDVIADMRRPYNYLRKLIDQSRDELLGAVREIPMRLHPALDVTELEAIVRQGFDGVSQYLEQKEEELPELSGLDLLTADEIRDELDRLVGDRVGAPFDNERLAAIYEEGAKRYERAIPPGYRDKDKPAPRCYGDLVIWNEILDYGVEKALSVILITDDQKDDWWWSAHGQKLGARRELIEEFRAKAGGDLLLYTPDRFMSLARERLGSNVTDDAVEEVEQTSQIVEESTSCPHCAWSRVKFRLGTKAGSSAIPRCPQCSFRFHAHRRGTGDVITTRGGLGRRVVAECPECRNQMAIDFSDGEAAKERVCLNCFANVEVRPDGTGDIIGYMQVADATLIDDRHVHCPRCATSHFTFAAQKGSIYAFCNRDTPRLLLRAASPDS